ncbi:hypothetical protein NEMIN01_2109 [Nematocida minor]|uniref:uncharacterized protein n=1 Tax=Nematocida minor TaxID=1912983 RepID=UPI00221F165A|nr:uncharacterized protein NEMIN01_2109 [Nematocida minor]KAI5192610.1 hypothetical protein NEMIN01_2109 [Nematocida minor]
MAIVPSMTGQIFRFKYFFTSKNFAMMKKEVKLRINIEKILEACNSIASKETSGFIGNGDSTVYMSELRAIFNKDSLEIESEHSAEEKENLLSAIKKKIFQYFAYNKYGMEDMSSLHEALMIGRKDLITSSCIRVLNGLIRENPFIYNPRHGIIGKIGADGAPETITLSDDNQDLSDRTCLLEVDLTNFSDTKSLLQFASEGLDRESFSYITFTAHLIRNSMNMDAGILKKYSPGLKERTLDELYTKKHKDTGVALIDHGMNFFYENYYKFQRLIIDIKGMDANLNSDLEIDLEEIAKKIGEVFTSEEDLEIFVSIKDNLTKVSYEKEIQKQTLKAIEYMANNALFSKEADGSIILKTSNSLSDFYRRYINKDLLEVVKKNKNRLNEEIEAKFASLEKEEEICEEKERLLQEMANNEDPLSSEDSTQVKEAWEKALQECKVLIKNLRHEIYLLQCAINKENLEHTSILKLLDNIPYATSPYFSPTQEEYMFEKINEFGSALNIKVVTSEASEVSEVEVPEETQEENAAAKEKNAAEEVSEEEHQVLEVDNGSKKGKFFSPRNMKAELVKFLLFAAFAIAAPVLFLSYYPKNEAPNAAETDECADLACHNQKLLKKHEEI